MSYILDALKKAEKERKLGTSPGFMDNHGEKPRQPRKRVWIYALLLIVIAVAGGLGWWFGYEGPENIRLPFQSSGVKQAEETAQPSKAEQQLNDQLKAEPQQTDQPVASDASPTVTIAPQARIERKHAEPAPKTEAPKPPVKAEEPRRPVKETAAEPAKTQQAEAETEGRPNPKKLYSYYELPDDVKKGLPEPVISTHIYSPEKSDRLVSVNGNIGREGQQLMPGVTLEAVQPDGIVLKYKGYRIKVRLR